jgi:thioesterase domain-containing protein
MARGYLAELRTVQPHGPYVLGGWSFGGVVAFEMAQQLMALGEPVATLVLLDSHAPSGRPAPEPDPLVSLAAFGTALGLPWRELSLDPDHLRRLGVGDRLAYVLEQARRSSTGALDLDLDQAERWFRRFERHLEALRRYTPRLYPGAGVVFRAATPSGSAPPSADLGWSAWITGGVATHEVTGDHRTMLRAPHAAVLAEHLDHHLSSAVGESRISRHRPG